MEQSISESTHMRTAMDQTLTGMQSGHPDNQDTPAEEPAHTQTCSAQHGTQAGAPKGDRELMPF